MGVVELGPRRKVFRAISQWREERDVKKAEVIRARMSDMQQPQAPPADATAQRLQALRQSMSQLPGV